MQFDGVVISDWCAVSELIPHGIAADEKEAAVLALNAGVDIDMASPVYLKNLKELAEQKRIDEKQIDESVLRILNFKKTNWDYLKILIKTAVRRTKKNCSSVFPTGKRQGTVQKNPSFC